MEDEQEPDWDLEDEGPEEAEGAEPPSPLAERKIARSPVGPDRRKTSHVWLISYSDFMTILMIFFLAMYGYAYMAKASLLEEKKKVMTYPEFVLEMARLEDHIDREVDVYEDLEKIVVQLPDDVLFRSGEAALSRKALKTIENLANSIKLVEGDIIVEGHTDNVPIKGGPFPSNWELSAGRAFSVIDSLTQNGVDPNRLAAWGFGENRPVASNESRIGRAQNRRIQIVLIKKKES